MVGNYLSINSKEHIFHNFKCYSRLDGLKFSIFYNSDCNRLSANFADVEHYIHETAHTLENLQSKTA